MNSANKLRWSNFHSEVADETTAQAIPRFQPGETLKLWTQVRKLCPHGWKLCDTKRMLSAAAEFVVVSYTAVEKEYILGSRDFTFLWYSPAQQVLSSLPGFRRQPGSWWPQNKYVFCKIALFLHDFQLYTKGEIMYYIVPGFVWAFRHTCTYRHMLSILKYGQEQLSLPACGQDASSHDSLRGNKVTSRYRSHHLLYGWGKEESMASLRWKSIKVLCLESHWPKRSYDFHAFTEQPKGRSEIGISLVKIWNLVLFIYLF